MITWGQSGYPTIPYQTNTGRTWIQLFLKKQENSHCAKKKTTLKYNWQRIETKKQSYAT